MTSKTLSRPLTFCSQETDNTRRGEAWDAVFGEGKAGSRQSWLSEVGTSGSESLERGVHTPQLHYLRGNPQRFWTSGTRRGLEPWTEKETRKAAPHASPDQEPQPRRSGLEKGSRRDWGSRLSLHRQLLRQAPSSPSEGATQPGEVTVGKFRRCPGTAAYLRSVNRKLSRTHWEHRSWCPLQLHRREHSLVYQQTSSVCSHRKLFSTPEAEPQATSQIWHLSSEKDAKCIDLKTFCAVSESCSLHLHSGLGEQNPGPPRGTTVLPRGSHPCLTSSPCPGAWTLHTRSWPWC